MDTQRSKTLRVGEWHVDSLAHEISKAGSKIRLDPRLMRLLMCLAERPGEIVSTEELLKRVWNEVVVTPDSVYQAIAALRRSLGDDPKKPAYISTAPRVGYRLIAEVTSAASLPSAPSAQGAGKRRANLVGAGLAGLTLAAVLGGLLLHWRHRALDPPAETIAVLPILDLTSQAMDQEYFADGMTEEFIERLSHVPNLRVSSASASFYYKSTKMPPAEIARALGVHYLLDGSVRQSGSLLRVTARLLRAKDGFVLWTQSYDGDVREQLKVQDEIAIQVARSLRQSIGSGAAR